MRDCLRIDEMVPVYLVWIKAYLRGLPTGFRKVAAVSYNEIVRLIEEMSMRL